ncbi:nitroreductase family protein [Clostridium omnivorum]|uniref:Nitroreductase n=1 Tax=Clostridium omnivorum TaxID=1604902 RepID=A0ABQ5N4X8_9CLOT|nr:nitroreductase family protein [Clostridium sp. E14]GLC30293.1 nitroreductase [Clostridium sp. E14]
MMLDLLKQRKSIRNFTEKDVSDEVINYILEAGRLSPSGGNAQSWKFGLIKDNVLINEISQIAYNQNWIKTANFLVVLCTYNGDKSRGGRDIQKSRFPSHAKIIEDMEDEIYTRLHMKEHQTKIPGTHMVIAALEHGLGSTWISYFNVDELSNILNLPKSYIASEIIAFGYPVNNENTTEKKSLSEVVFYNKFI